MPAYATQTAPKQTQNSQQQPKKQKPEAPKGLAALPQSAGIAARGVMVALALPIGNFRALQTQTARRNELSFFPFPKTLLFCFTMGNAWDAVPNPARNLRFLDFPPHVSLREP